MFAILRREFSAYFNSALGYVFLAVFYLFAGFYFMVGSLFQDVSDLTQTYGSLFSIMLFLIPILTMRLLSEDRKNKTDQALLTSPVSITGMVLGKFFAAVAVFCVGLSVTLVYALVLAVHAPPNWPVILGNFLSLLLLGMALISIGLFISSLTENQFIAAVGGFAVGLFLLLADSMRTVVTNSVLRAVIGALSFYDRYSDFTVGIFDLANVLFFFSICFVFVFLTVRVFEKRRWS